jgi:cation/acetate symporter
VIALAAILAVTGGTVGLGLYGVRIVRTTSDLFVASRAVTPWWNAAAISGEYLSAASFLGIAGLEMKIGVVALWLPLGYTAGYLALLLFVAAPLRRLGAYTISDFAEARLASPRLRLLSGVVVLAIVAFYLVPQLKGAGLTLAQVVGAPYWVGVVAVGGVVAGLVASGGMRGITYVQAFQYWIKTFAIALPAMLLLIHLGGLPARAAIFGHDVPRAGASGLTVKLDAPQKVTFPRATTYSLDGRPARARAGETTTLPATTLRLPPRAAVPVADGATAQDGEAWARPVGRGEHNSLLAVYSLVLATFLGTMGLPHILVRFYTNRDGRAARRTTVRVLGLLALFYAFPALYGALGRVLVPKLYATGATDAVVLELPHAAWPGVPGELLGALVAAGAFAAFLSTASGLTVSLAGALSSDLLRGRRGADGVSRRMRFRIAAAVGIAPPVVLALAARGLDISVLVGWAFALAASTFCPMLLLGVWWRGLTARGALAGMLTGAVLATGAIFTGLALHGHDPSTIDALLVQPAVLSVPGAFAVMVAASWFDRRPRVEPEILALHAPEGLRLGLEEALAGEPAEGGAAVAAAPPPDPVVSGRSRAG